MKPIRGGGELRVIEDKYTPHKKAAKQKRKKMELITW